MHLAATWGRADSIRVLVDMKGDVEAKDVSGAGVGSMTIGPTNLASFISQLAMCGM